MKQRRGSNHGPSKIERKSEQRDCRGSNHGPSKNEATQREQSRTIKNERKSEQSNLQREQSRTVKNRQNVQKRSKMVKIDVFGSGEWPAACSAKNQYKVAVKRTCV